MPNNSIDDKLHWYKDAIIYELHIKAFADSNADGVGDFGGLLQKLDYLQELGVTAIWLLPFYPSPLRDDGYDIADYYSINPTYGTLEDFQKFLDEAHSRGLKVITELVINHTSDQHPWFQKARHAPKDSPERNFYVWSDDPNKYKDVRIIFQDFESSNWTWDPIAGQYYWHRFFYHQPDLNYDNPAVQEEIIKILDYWCEMGVDGFRLDAVPYLFEREGTNGENLPETHAFLKKLRKHIDEKFPGTVFLAEANMWPEDAASYFGDGDECHMNYHFPVMPRMFMSVQMEDRYPILDIFDQTPPIPENCQWAMFLRNHDELTLEMVTDEERDYMYKVYAKDPKARINLGIRHRLAPLMDNNRRKIELMNALLFSLHGTPVIYYGDEIGMGDNFYLGDRDGVRTPMQWSADRNAGFSKANPQQLYLPVILDPEYHFESVNVELQKSNTSSLFWYMKQIINVRKKFKVFGRGDLKFVSVDNPKVLAFTRTYRDENLLVVVNLSKFSQPAELNIKGFAGYRPYDIFSNNPFPDVAADGHYFLTLSAHSYLWFILQKTPDSINHEQSLPSFKLNDETELNKAEKKQLEENILPGYLRKVEWFINHQRRIHNISIENRFLFNADGMAVNCLLIEVNFESGLPQYFILAFCVLYDEQAKNIKAQFPQAVVANVQTNKGSGFLCDAYYVEQFQQFIAKGFSDEAAIQNEKQAMVFESTEFGKEASVGKITPQKPRMYFGNKNLNIIVFGESYFIKLYRQVEPGTNPDVEIINYLTNQADFKCTPSLYGILNWTTAKATINVGIMQSMFQNHGQGEMFMLERINNYIERVLARDYAKFEINLTGSFTSPVSYDELSEEMKVLIGNSASEQASQMGILIADMHMALSTPNSNKAFFPEDFSLHYQRSLYSGMQTLVRASLQNLSRSADQLPEPVLAKHIAGQRNNILEQLKRIYSHKMDVVKIRTHGNLKLRKISLTGKGLAVNDFSGNPKRSFSERRIKRSPLRDVVSMIRSFYYVAYEGFFNSRHMQANEMKKMLPFAEMWAWYMSSFFLEAYYKRVKPEFRFFSEDKGQLKILLEAYIIEKALQDLNDEIETRPEFSVIPLRILNNILEKGI